MVLGTAPDAFDGVHMKGEYLMDGAGGTNKPYSRVYVGRRHRSLRSGRGVVARRVRPIRYVPGGRRGEDVAAPPAPGLRVLEHLRPHAREAAGRLLCSGYSRWR